MRFKWFCFNFWFFFPKKKGVSRSMYARYRSNNLIGTTMVDLLIKSICHLLQGSLSSLINRSQVSTKFWLFDVHHIFNNHNDSQEIHKMKKINKVPGPISSYKVWLLDFVCDDHQNQTKIVDPPYSLLRFFSLTK